MFLVQLAAIACAASAQSPYPDNGNLVEPEHGYPCREEQIYQLVYPPEIFDCRIVRDPGFAR